MRVEIGNVVAKMGAWQRKYQVMHITKAPEEHNHGGSPHLPYIVCLKYLGEFYADGRTKPSVKCPEREVRCGAFRDGDVSLDWYRVDKKWDGTRILRGT